MSKLNTVPLDETGHPLSDDALLAFLDEAEVIEVPYTKRNGKTVTLHALVDHTRAKAPHLKKYQRDVQEIAEIADRRAEEEEAAAARAVAEGNPFESEANAESEKSELQSRFDVIDEMQAYARAAADLLGRIVIEIDIPGVEVHPENGVASEFLCERAGVGPALRGALFVYFFPSLKRLEVETGTNEEANITLTSVTSEATEDAENIPPTSSSSTSPAPSKSRRAKS